jgi:hypothetical protein
MVFCSGGLPTRFGAGSSPHFSFHVLTTIRAAGANLCPFHFVARATSPRAFCVCPLVQPVIESKCPEVMVLLTDSTNTTSRICTSHYLPWFVLEQRMIAMTARKLEAHDAVARYYRLMPRHASIDLLILKAHLLIEEQMRLIIAEHFGSTSFWTRHGSRFIRRGALSELSRSTPM